MTSPCMLLPEVDTLQGLVCMWLRDPQGGVRVLCAVTAVLELDGDRRVRGQGLRVGVRHRVVARAR